MNIVAHEGYSVASVKIYFVGGIEANFLCPLLFKIQWLAWSNFTCGLS